MKVPRQLVARFVATFIFSALPALGCGSKAAAQDVLVTFNPQMSLNSSSQAVQLDFSGTVENLTTSRLFFAVDGIENPYDDNDHILGVALPSTFPITLEPKATYTGTFFFINVPANQPSGLYNKNGLGGTANFLYNEYRYDSTDSPPTVYTKYSVSILPAAVPEASTTVSLGLLLMLGLGGMAVVAKRRKSAASA